MHDKSTKYIAELIASAGQIIQIEAKLFQSSADAAADVDFIPFLDEPEIELYAMPHLATAISTLNAVYDALNNTPKIESQIPETIASTDDARTANSDQLCG